MEKERSFFGRRGIGGEDRRETYKLNNPRELLSTSQFAV